MSIKNPSNLGVLKVSKLWFWISTGSEKPASSTLWIIHHFRKYMLHVQILRTYTTLERCSLADAEPQLDVAAWSLPSAVIWRTWWEPTGSGLATQGGIELSLSMMKSALIVVGTEKRQPHVMFIFTHKTCCVVPHVFVDALYHQSQVQSQWPVCIVQCHSCEVFALPRHIIRETNPLSLSITWVTPSLWPKHGRYVHLKFIVLLVNYSCLL